MALDPQPALMTRAGVALARLTLALAPAGRRLVVLAGPGNNGGDGIVAAHRLHQLGWQVRVCLVADAARLPAEAAAALQAAVRAGVDIATIASDDDFEATMLDDADLLIDALLGLGTSRAPSGAIARAIEAINACRERNPRLPVLAVDLPSGLHPDTGARLGAVAVRATATLSLLTLKPGCFTHDGRDHAATVWLASLGVDAGAPTAWLAGASDLPARAQASHKGTFGNVVVIGGASGMTGALWLASRAASAAGAGRVYVSPLGDDVPLLDPQHPELIGRRHAWQSSAQWLAEATAVCGCGGGDGTLLQVLPGLLSRVPRLVLDADALNALAADAALEGLLRGRAAREQHTLLTPHPLEAARLLSQPVASVQADRLLASKTLARRFDCAVLLKGSGSIVAAPGRLPSINPTGNAALATAGTGDVLAGWAGGLWAQMNDASAFDIGTMAAWQQGRAADTWPPASAGATLRASELVDVLAHHRW